MKKSLYLLMIALMASCHPREFSTIQNFDAAGKKKLTLDNTYQFFVREIYKESTNHNYSLTDKKAKTDSSKKELIEIEYILYSEQHHKLLYITTVPDRFQKYYSDHALPQTQMNARDFNTFHFGNVRLNKREVDFKTYKKNTTYTWQYDVDLDSLVIRRIIETKNGIYQNERSVENSIYDGAKFRRMNRFEFIYKNNKANDSTILKMADPTLYVSRKRKKYSVYFNFDTAIPLKDGEKNNRSEKEGSRNSTRFTTIIFKGPNRIPYSPESVME